MKDCKFCDKTGLLILPLRYAAIATGSKGLVPEMPAHLDAGVKDLALDQGQYAPRLLREGYLYTLIHRKEITYWEAYAVTEDAFLYKFRPEEPPTIKIEFTCDRSSCGIDASCIAIDKVETVDKMYWLFTPSALTTAKLNEYKAQADAFVAAGKMQTFDPKAWVRGDNPKQAHSLTPELLGQYVPEWQIYQQCAGAHDSALGKALKQQMFPATSAAYAGLPAPAPDQPAPGRLGLLQHKLKRRDSQNRRQGAAFVVHDHIGIAQELNDFRNAALEGVEHYLAATDKYGASNQQRLQVYEAIQEVKAGLHAGVVQTAQVFQDQHQQTSDQWFERQQASAQMLRNTGRADEALRIEQDIERSRRVRDGNYRKAAEESKATAATNWANKYASRLDTDEMETFYATLDAHLAAAFAKVDGRSAQHLKWFVSDRLVKAFDTYDATSQTSGYAFAVHSAICTFGIAGCKAAEDQLDEWIKATDVTRANLYMRGFFYNQTDLINAARQANQEIMAAVGSVEYASAINPAFMVRATKGLVDSFKKTDSAFDEWVRNQGQDFSRKWSKGPEIVLYHKASDMTRTVFRAGLGGSFDKALTARISGVLYAKLRAVSASLAFDEIMLTISKEQIAAHQRARAGRRAEQRRVDKAETRAAKVASQVDDSLEALIADAQAKARQSPSLKQLRGNASPPTNNYHQTRMGVVLGCIEMIALGEKLTHFENNSKGWLEVGGSIAAVLGIVSDTYYSAAKSIREIKPYSSVKAIKDGADIVRGGFKLGAGVLGAVAGFAAAYLDFTKLKTENDPTLASIFGVRAFTGFVSAALTLRAGVSYCGPMLEHVAKGHAAHSIRHRALIKAANTALAWSTRVRLLVWMARLNWAGLGLTALEIGYLSFKDNELQNWCEMSVFRKDKVGRNWLGRLTESARFDGAAKELESLERASQVVLAGD